MIKIKVDQEKLEVAVELLRALAHPLRLQIIGFIDEHKSIHVNKIYNTLNLEQSITSQHLRILRKAELVITQREGKFIHYSLNYPKLQSVNNHIQEFLAKNDDV